MTVIGALPPVIVTLLVGVVAGWHHDFDAKQAPRDQLTADASLAAVIVIAMILGFFVPLLVARFLCGRDLMTASLQALAIGAPSVAFIGFPVLGYLFGDVAARFPWRSAASS